MCVSLLCDYRRKDYSRPVNFVTSQKPGKETVEGKDGDSDSDVEVCVYCTCTYVSVYIFMLYMYAYIFVLWITYYVMCFGVIHYRNDICSPRI